MPKALYKQCKVHIAAVDAEQLDLEVFQLPFVSMRYVSKIANTLKTFANLIHVGFTVPTTEPHAGFHDRVLDAPEPHSLQVAPSNAYDPSSEQKPYLLTGPLCLMISDGVPEPPSSGPRANALAAHCVWCGVVSSHAGSPSVFVDVQQHGTRHAGWACVGGRRAYPTLCRGCTSRRAAGLTVRTVPTDGCTGGQSAHHVSWKWCGITGLQVHGTGAAPLP